MKKVLLGILVFALAIKGEAQSAVTQKLQAAWKQFETDPQLKYAISSLYVIDARTGQVVFDRNSRVGLAPASTQKIITAATAFAVLGPEFRYNTPIGYDIGIRDGELRGSLFIEGSGDPTLGSERFSATGETAVMNKIIAALRNHKVNRISDSIWIDDARFGVNPVPDRWIWQDIGNYYGAGVWGLNWKENQYDLVLAPGQKEDGYVEVKRTEPELHDYALTNTIRAGRPGSGDNGYIYYSPYGKNGFATGTVPLGTSEFTISGSMPFPSREFGYALQQALAKAGILAPAAPQTYLDAQMQGRPLRRATHLLDSIQSPPLDSIVYWFLKKSVNLYGEALLRTLAVKREFNGDPDRAIQILKNYWKEKGLDPAELNIYDGSGLSPMNRVTTHVQVEILKEARKQSWFAAYLKAFPEYNGMTMKSGTIGDVKGFAGYHQAANGNEYIFSFLVNNYNGSSSSLVGKMYRVLNVLK